MEAFSAPCSPPAPTLHPKADMTLADIERAAQALDEIEALLKSAQTNTGRISGYEDAMNDIGCALSLLPTLRAELAPAADGAGEVEENARLREALQAIADRHIPDQPPAYDVSEADYARKHYMELRMLARAALKEPG
jgi:hypothetical protein